jgi:large subunit ribosomal protein L29
MKAEELTVLEQHELADRLRQSRRELYELRFQVAVGQLENNRQIRKVKKDIARILTVIRMRELAGVGAATEAATPPPAADAAASPSNGEEVSEDE